MCDVSSSTIANDSPQLSVAVIIPFYQRDPGFLRTAVASVFAQKLTRAAKVEVIVVDDGSPTTVEDERLPQPPEGFALRVIHKANGGAGAARNAGLDALDGDTELVAFLDSDDAWFDNHLDIALQCMQPTTGMYFSNVKDDGNLDLFDCSPFMVSLIEAAKGDQSYYHLPALKVFDLCIRDYFIHTSQVVYRFNQHSQLRFRTDVRRSGEDILMWLYIISSSIQVSFSLDTTGFRGRGISINRESFQWGHFTGIERSIDEIIYRNTIIDRFNINDDQTSEVKKQRLAIETTLTFLMLRNAFRKPGKVITGLGRLTSSNIGYFVRLPAILLDLPRHRAALLERERDWSRRLEAANRSATDAA